VGAGVGAAEDEEVEHQEADDCGHDRHPVLERDVDDVGGEGEGREFGNERHALVLRRGETSSKVSPRRSGRRPGPKPD
jgi:hypothetical protein